MEIAIAYHDGNVGIWCSHLGVNEAGEIRFFVKNGGWYGTYKDGVVYVEETKQHLPGTLVWAGKAESGDYNEVIPWIQEQLNDKMYGMMSMEEILAYNPRLEVRSGWYDDEDDIPF